MLCIVLQCLVQFLGLYALLKICTSGDRTSGGPPVDEFSRMLKIDFKVYSFLLLKRLQLYSEHPVMLIIMEDNQL
jgi:hypothetical protein